MTVMTSAPPLLAIPPPFPVLRLPFVLNSRDLGPIAAQELLP